MRLGSFQGKNWLIKSNYVFIYYQWTVGYWNFLSTIYDNIKKYNILGDKSDKRHVHGLKDSSLRHQFSPNWSIISVQS